MPGEWRGPAKAWDDHRDGYWNDALDVARAQGWSYRSLSAHRVGEVRCPTGEHSQKIDSTSRWSETKSKDLIKLVTHKCPHGAQAAATLARAQDLVDTAVELVETAEQGVVLISAAEQADDALARAEAIEIMLDTADANIEQLLAERDALLEEAAAAPDPPPIEEVIATAEQAGERSAQARKTLRQLASFALRKPLLAQVEAVESRVEAVLRELEP